MSSAIVHSYYFTEAGLLAFIEFHSLYNLLIEVLVQVPGVVIILCSMLTSVVLCEGVGLGLETKDPRSWSWSRVFLKRS